VPISREFAAPSCPQRRLPLAPQSCGEFDQFGRITALAESARTPGLLYVALDEGAVHVTRDGGKTWINVTAKFRDVPDGTAPSCISTSPHEANTAYAAFNRRVDDDYTPYVFMTTDAGHSWKSIASNLQGAVNVVREDPRNPELLYLGTDAGLYVSPDRGGRWTRLKSRLPAVSVEDVLVHPRDNDLIVTTAGRGIWILDDVTPLQEGPSAAAAPGPYLFGVRPATQFTAHTRHARFQSGVFIAQNRLAGAIVSYHLKEATTRPIRLVISSTTDAVVRELAGTSDRGVNRVTWDARMPPPRTPPPGVWSDTMWADAFLGAFVTPGEYRVMLFVGDDAHGTRAIRVDADPLMEISDRARDEQQRAVSLLTALQDSLSASAAAAGAVWAELRSLREQFRVAPVPGALRLAGRALFTALFEVQQRVGPRIPVDDDELPSAATLGIARERHTPYPLRARVQVLKSEISASPSAPTAAQVRTLQRLSDDVGRVLSQLDSVIGNQLTALNRLLEDTALHGIRVPQLPARSSDTAGH
jgi:hypothetical protein